MGDAVAQAAEEFIFVGVRAWLMGELRASLLLNKPMRSLSFATDLRLRLKV